MSKRLLIVLALLLAGVLHGQQMPFIFVPGGPTNVRVLFQDHLGRLWVGGATDVACFDGSRFYSLHDFGFPSVGVQVVTEDTEGAIWIGSEVGVYRFAQGALTRVMDGYVTALAAASGIVIVSAGPEGQGLPQAVFLSRIQRISGGWRSDRVLENSYSKPFSLNNSKTSVMLPVHEGWGNASVQDIINWHKGTSLNIQKHSFRGGKQAPNGAGSGPFLEDRFSCVWSRNELTTGFLCPGDARPTFLDAFTSHEAMSEGADGTMLFPNDHALVIGRPAHLQTVTAAQGLPDTDQAIKASDGTIWLGGSRGTYRWPTPFRLEYWTQREGITPGYSVSKVKNRVFAGSGQDGLAVLDEDRARWTLLPKTKPLGLVLALLPDLNGGVFTGSRLGHVNWAGPDGNLLRKPREGTGTCTRLLRTLDNDVLGSGGGIFQITRVKHDLPLEDQKLSASVMDMEIDPKSGKLWACTSAGLMSREKDGWRAITTKDGLADNACISLAVLPGGDVWMGYMNRYLLARVRPNATGKTRVQNFSAGERENASIHFLNVDSRGWLWRGTDDGVYAALPSDAENNMWIHLNELDGLEGIDMSQQAFYSDPDGSVWWVSSDAVQHFSPSPDFAHPTFTPDVFVSGISWNGTPAKLAESITNVPRGSTITAHIGSLQFDRRNALRLRYRMLPEQSLWQESRNLDLPLGILPWGDHRLEVQAKLLTGPWSATVAQSFTVLRPFWATWPFVLGFITAGTGAGVGGYRWRRRWERIKRRALPDLSRLRTDAMLPEAQMLMGKALDGRFLPQRVLARGGFATVFDGQDQKQNRRCAIKVFHREIADQGLAQRFAHEVAALETIVHPNVVRIYGHGKTSMDVPYLVMEFIEGKTLRDAIPDGGLPPREVARLLRQAGDALAAIHAQGICHRDLKPDNLMIGSSNEQLVLIDFSIAIVKSPDKTVHGLSRAAGTIQYMAPEQAVGWADASSDIYSLAKVVMEMITGRRLSELLPQASRDLPERVREFLQTLPIKLSEESISLIASALEFDPARRPADAVQFAATIASDLETNPPADSSATSQSSSSGNSPAGP